MVLRRKQYKEQLASTGEALVQEFVLAFHNEILVLNMKDEARRNELLALGEASSLSNTQDSHVLVPAETQFAVARDSLNAHMQKAQAMQADVYNQDRLQEAQAMIQARYKGRKVQVRIIVRGQKPVETAWRDHFSGKLSISSSRPNKVTGFIAQVNIADNYMILRPGLLARSFKHSLEFYRIYIVNPDDCKPMVLLNIA